jgi:radical SAM superfamily enzyme YgiQ (UPF0313 family)
VTEAPLLRFALPDGRPATLLLREDATVLSVDDVLVSSWDLSGRPYALVREGGTYRRGLDGGLLRKREAGASSPRLRERLNAAEGETVVEAARRDAEAALSSLVPRLGSGSPSAAGDTAEAVRRLGAVVAMDAAALREDARCFLAASGPVGILPPDQYLSLAVRVTEGCSWNVCTFCRLYRDVPFRFKDEQELRRHVAALLAHLGPSIALRRSVFLGDANALCLSHERLLPLVETIAHELPGRPLFSFVDAWTGRRRTPSEWRELARLGLARVYVGLESGDPVLLGWLEKPGSAADAVELVGALHEAGLAAGVVVLLGAGGERFSASHVARTAGVLAAMRLRAGDILYFSEYVDDPGLAYGHRAASAPDLRPLPPERCAEQRRAIVEAVRGGWGKSGPRVATYDIREFVY